MGLETGRINMGHSESSGGHESCRLVFCIKSARYVQVTVILVLRDVGLEA